MFKRNLLLVIAILGMSINILSAQYGIGLGGVVASQPVVNSDGDGYRVGYGVQLKLDYEISEGLYIAPDFQYYAPSNRTTVDTEVSSFYYSANLDIQYDLHDNQYNRGYIFGGGTFARPGSEGVLIINGVPQEDKIRINWNEVGFNIGVGAEQNFGMYMELRYQHTFYMGEDILRPTVRNGSQIIFGVGYRFQTKKEEAIDESIGMF